MTVIMLDKKTWFCDHLEEEHLSASPTIFTPHVFTPQKLCLL